MKYQLVIQFPSATLSFDDLIYFEEILIESLGDSSEVDGHDFGSGEGNIFILTDEPTKVFSVIKNLAIEKGLTDLKAAYRLLSGEEFAVLWPPTLKIFKIK